MKELTIGQMARLNGVSEQTLRLYDRTGLFSPMYRDEENGYRYYDIRQSAQLDMINDIMNLIQSFIAAVAGISLLVGGIGIMNIMLVSVTERTREIGIRKSLGAKTNAILFQFLTESAIITLIGGVIGLVLGVIGAYIFSAFGGFDPVFTPISIFMTVLFSAAVGIFFGLYPARKAANMRPIDALRHD